MGRCAELLLIIALSRPSRSFLLPPRSAGSGPPAVAKAATASPAYLQTDATTFVQWTPLVSW